MTSERLQAGQRNADVDCDPARGDLDNCPLISVIIPVYNGAQTLQLCLEAVFHSDCARYEVIVADDGSTDDSVAIARRFPCTVITAPCHRGAAAARNRAAAQAKGEILFFTDADVMIRPDTLTRVMQAFAVHPECAAIIGTYTKETPVQNFVSKYKNLQHHWVGQTTPTYPASFFTACGAVRRAVFDTTKFNESWDRCLEDVVFGMDLVDRGLVVYIDRTITVAHLKSYSLLSLIQSDLWRRAVPWTRLLLQRHQFPNELNTTWRDRLAVALSFLLPAVGLAALVELLPLEISVFVATGLAFAFLAANRSFFKFLWRDRGLGFLLRAIPLNYIFYLCCGLGLVIGQIIHLFDILRHADHKCQAHLTAAEKSS
jgi:glycosyltransferase involved in cell wall biosynthesis